MYSNNIFPGNTAEVRIWDNVAWFARTHRGATIIRLLRHGDHRISRWTHRNTTNHTDSPEVHRVVMMTAHRQHDARRQITQMIISDYRRILNNSVTNCTKPDTLAGIRDDTDYTRGCQTSVWVPVNTHTRLSEHVWIILSNHRSQHTTIHQIICNMAEWHPDTKLSLRRAKSWIF